uniref:Uncharacterized protein n=1 Tax=Fagus sylvatica TaxID=28930 RepID=A0A2N9GYV7_FAGSY
MVWLPDLGVVVVNHPVGHAAKGEPPQACRQALPCSIPTVGGHPSVPISAWPVPAVPMNSNLQRKGHRKWSSAEPCRLVAEILNFGC